MPGRIIGEWFIGGIRDNEGHREYKIGFKVEVLIGEGPAEALQTSGLPLPGSTYAVYSDYDAYAYCLPGVTVKPEYDDGETCTIYTLEFVYSTKPINRCGDAKVEDPLLEPPKISGSYSKYREEITRDLLGPVLNSAFEQLRGPNVEFDANRLSIKIEQNVASPLQGFILPNMLLDTVNDAPLWGIGAGKIKLSSAPFERVYHGQCYVYYHRTLEFEIQWNGFDRWVVDEATKALKGHWHATLPLWIVDLQADGVTPLDKDIPNNFQRMLDEKHNAIKVILDGLGRPFVPDAMSYCTFSSIGVATAEAAQVGGYLLGPYTTESICNAQRLAFDPNAVGIYCTYTGAVIPGTSTGVCTTTVSRNALRTANPNGTIFGPFLNSTDCFFWCISGGDFFAHYWAIYVPESASSERLIRKYPSSNFLTLGIPTVI